MSTRQELTKADDKSKGVLVEFVGTISKMGRQRFINIPACIFPLLEAKKPKHMRVVLLTLDE